MPDSRPPAPLPAQRAGARSYSAASRQAPATPGAVFLRLAVTLAIGLAVALLGNAYASLAMR